VKIPRPRSGELQRNLLRSHAAGVGEPLPPRAVRAMMALRANVLAKGYSGIRRATLDRLIEALNARVHPVVPSRGSVGASGDLAPLAPPVAGPHRRRERRRRRRSGAGRRRAALARAGIAPVTLEPKEGLALINGTQASTAVAALALLGAERLGPRDRPRRALSIDGLRGSYHPFEARLHDVRPHPGQRASAGNLLRLLQHSPINASHENCGRVPGRVLDALRASGARRRTGRVRATRAKCSRSRPTPATDNPMVFAGAARSSRAGTSTARPSPSPRI
jgi:histidine ammonia-lyase